MKNVFFFFFHFSNAFYWEQIEENKITNKINCSILGKLWSIYSRWMTAFLEEWLDEGTRSGKSHPVLRWRAWCAAQEWNQLCIIAMQILADNSTARGRDGLEMLLIRMQELICQ